MLKQILCQLIMCLVLAFLKAIYTKAFLRRPLENRQNKDLNDKWSKVLQNAPLRYIKIGKMHLRGSTYLRFLKAYGSFLVSDVSSFNFLEESIVLRSGVRQIPPPKKKL